MQKLDEIYNLNLIIADHFDLKINAIDIHAEELICKAKSESEIDELNDEREKIVNQIEHLRDLNLRRNASKQAMFEARWQHFIVDPKMSYQTKLDSFRREFIRPDCFLLKDFNYRIEYSLWVTNWYNDKEHVDFRWLFIF